MTPGSTYPTAPAPPPPPLGYPPPPMGYAPLQGRLKAVKIVFCVIVVVSVLAVISDLLEVRLLGRMIDGEDVSESQIDFNDARQGIAGLLQTGALIAGAVVFIMWLHRAYRNADAVAPGVRRFGHGWAIGGWFVPVLWLWRPKQVVNDVWRAGGHPPEPSGLLAAWWTLWLVTIWLDRFAVRAWLGGDTPEEIREGSIAYMVSDALDVATAILAILAATTLTRRLDARAALGPPPLPPAPAEAPEESSFEIPWRPPPPPLGQGR